MRRRAAGQGATENLLVISFVTIATVGAGATFLPAFRAGVGALGEDVEQILSSGAIGDTGASRSAESGPASSPGPSTDIEDMNDLMNDFERDPRVSRNGNGRRPGAGKGDGYTVNDSADTKGDDGAAGPLIDNLG